MTWKMLRHGIQTCACPNCGVTGTPSYWWDYELQLAKAIICGNCHIGQLTYKVIETFEP
jgi:hypothetical protein